MTNSIFGMSAPGILFWTGVMMGGVFGTVGCKDDGSGGNPDSGEAVGEGDAGGDTADGAASGACGKLVQKLVGCGLMTAGTYRCEVADGPLGDCIMACSLDAACEELTTERCEEVGSDAILTCVNGCRTQSFDCGDGTSESLMWVCDGSNDCAGGEDEAAAICPRFQCTDGTTIKGSWQCDGQPNCADGSDELPANCPTFACASGETIPASAECDLVVDCGDGSDEHAQCARLSCPQ